MGYWEYDAFPAYVSVAERKAQAAKKIAALKKQGRKVSPVQIQGLKIATTFWGKAWCENLEAYSDLASRLPRGRSYARSGAVIDLQLAAGRVDALVQGSELYEVTVEVDAVPKPRWKKVVAACAGKIDSMVELLSGKLSQAVMQVLCRQDQGLFPTPRELRFSCSCPDGAAMCKHVAAALYGVGARLDHTPELLFLLRGADQLDLVAAADAGGGLGKASSPAVDAGLGELFGIELVDGAPAAKPVKKVKAPRRKVQSKPRPRTHLAKAPPRRKPGTRARG